MSTGRQPTAPLKMKLRTATLSMDYSGGTADGIEFAFSALHAKPKTREKLLAALTLQHQRMLAQEAKALAGEPGQAS